METSTSENMGSKLPVHGVKKLIEKITEDVDEEALEDASFEQEVMNTIVAQMCLPHLSEQLNRLARRGMKWSRFTQNT